MADDQTYTAGELAEIIGKHKTSVMRRAKTENWPYIKDNGKGGAHHRYPLANLPADLQDALILKEGISADHLPALAPSVAERALDRLRAETASVPDIPTFADVLANKTSSWSPETAISEADLQNPRIKKILAILRDVESMPRTWDKGKRKWIELVALKHGVSFQAIYRWLKKYQKSGIAGLRHTKSTADNPRAWAPEAVDFWVGLCGKREHRDANRRDLYDILLIEASRRSWQVGGYESANWWFKKRWNPLLEAMQKGGIRALDNLLPPVLRDYSDLAPFEILVGDQHRFDRWVVDDDTGEVFRPEGYLWQDLRTRIIYGAAVDRKYDAWLIGLALRLGIACYGAFGSIYTDNGKPECSRFLTGILANMHSLGMEWERTEDVTVDVLDMEAEDIDPHYTAPGAHRKAVVKNAKAKLIEGTFHNLERLMSSRMMLPGKTKRLSDDIHWQDIDHHEAVSLAKSGKLLTAREFALALYTACDIYNQEKAHRGVLREWSWQPKPAQATPWDCLKACYNEGWRPRMVSPEASDLIFLAKTSRIVNQGRINFENEIFEADALLGLHKQRVDLRYNPMTQDELHVFIGGRYLCTAAPVERSSMKDMDLASRKIEEKRERRKRFAEEFRKITGAVPDFREYSHVPQAERVAALIGDERRKRAAENKQIAHVSSQEEIDAHIAKMEQGLPLQDQKGKRLPARPSYFLDEAARMVWILEFIQAGGELSVEDTAFRDAYLAKQPRERRDYYEFMMAQGG